MYNYPNKKKIKRYSQETSRENSSVLGNTRRGMDLEDILNAANNYYADNDIALIYKKPTPIKINKIEHSSAYGVRKHRITDGYFSEKSTTDYNGLYRGYYVDFEAKQTKYKSFNVGANLHEHQILHLERVLKQGGLAFLIVYFYQYDKIYIIDYQLVVEYLRKKVSQIPREFFVENGYELKLGINPSVDYLKYIDKIIEKRQNG